MDYRLLVEERQEQTHSGIYNDLLIVVINHLNEFENINQRYFKMWWENKISIVKYSKERIKIIYKI